MLPPGGLTLSAAIRYRRRRLHSAHARVRGEVTVYLMQTVMLTTAHIKCDKQQPALVVRAVT